ncbi:MAG: exosortase [Planctomycetota bacterium]|nr:MAG: exosortase [Planctomycetota bacterium]
MALEPGSTSPLESGITLSRATRKRSRSLSPTAAAAAAKQAERRAEPRSVEGTLSYDWSSWQFVAGAAALLVALVWSYWPTLAETVHAWDTIPDYSHGYLVLPIAAWFLWARRGEFPRDQLRSSQWGWAFLIAALAIRWAAAYIYIEAVDGWTLPLWIAGTVLLLFGPVVARWAAPAIIFLWFMFPLPYSAEMFLSQPLQGAATKISTAVLQMLGQPALSEGNVILIGERQFEVAQACSGLRIFVGIFALAFAYVLFTRRAWWEKAMLLASAVPITLVANSTRIVATALLQQYVSGEAADKFTHDFAGWVMIPFAAALFWLFLVYISRLFPEVETVSIRQAKSPVAAPAEPAVHA